MKKWKVLLEIEVPDDDENPAEWAWAEWMNDEGIPDDLYAKVTTVKARTIK